MISDDDSALAESRSTAENPPARHPAIATRLATYYPDHMSPAAMDVRAELVGAAKCGLTVTLSRLLFVVDRTIFRPAMSWINTVLTEVSVAEAMAGRPILTALAVTKKTGRPPQVVLEIMRDLGLHAGCDDEEMWPRECAAVHSYWCRNPRLAELVQIFLGWDYVVASTLACGNRVIIKWRNSVNVIDADDAGAIRVNNLTNHEVDTLLANRSVLGRGSGAPALRNLHFVSRNSRAMLSNAPPMALGDGDILPTTPR